MLREIIRHKRVSLDGIDLSREITAIESLLPKMVPVKSLRKSLMGDSSISIIAEIKRQSPSRGKLAPDLSVEKLAVDYELAGARGISVLTDRKYFGGSNHDLMTARHYSSLPVLRKDFILHEYQVWESRLIGADAILLIAAVLETDELKRLYSLAGELGLEVLIEVHTKDEIDLIGPLNPDIIGINNRDLNSFTVDLATTEELRQYIPDDAVCISESGLKTRDDLVRLQSCGIDAVLIGEGIVTSPNPADKIRELLGTRHDEN